MPSGRSRASRRPPGDDPVSRERAKDALHRELDRGADPEEAARAALRLSEECVEAWLVLADAATSLDEARQRIRRAVEVSTLVLGERRLRTGRGHLGAEPDGLVHLHALAALARVQSAEDRAEQAVQTLHGVLDLDPDDPAAVRGDLLLLLLALARDEEAEEVVARHALEANVDWMYGRALLRRRRAVDPAGLARADDALDRALAAFPAAAASITSPDTVRAPGRAAVDPLLAQAFDDTEGAVGWVRARETAAAAAAAGPRAEPGSATGHPSDAGSDAPAPAEAAALADRRFSAQEHVEEAWEATGGRREALARRALELWPDCADAWRAIASLARSPADRVGALTQAVAAALRALGRAAADEPRAFPDDEDGRRAGTARHELVGALLEAARPDDAERQARRLLVEDPDDVRKGAVELAARLVVADRDADAADLVSAHAEDASPDWSWLAVLLARRGGDRVRAAFALGEAVLTAPRVGEILRLGRVPPPTDDDPHEASWREAGAVVARIRAAWDATPGALEWLRSQRPPPRSSSRSAPGSA